MRMKEPRVPRGSLLLGRTSRLCRQRRNSFIGPSRHFHLLVLPCCKTSDPRSPRECYSVCIRQPNSSCGHPRCWSTTGAKTCGGIGGGGGSVVTTGADPGRFAGRGSSSVSV